MKHLPRKCSILQDFEFQIIQGKEKIQITRDSDEFTLTQVLPKSLSCDTEPPFAPHGEALSATW